MSPRYPRLRSYFKDGRALTSDTIVICFYMKRPHQQLAGAVMRALDLLRERIHPYRFQWRASHDGQLHTLSDSAWNSIRKEMLGPDEVVVLNLEGFRKDASGFFVDYRGLRIPSPWPNREHDTSVLHLRLPTEYLEERGPAHVRTLALDMAETLPFSSGYVDLCLCDLHTSSPKALLNLVRTRYLGLHLAGSGADFHVDTWVDGVHWMNFLGQPVLGKLGGVAALRQSLAHLEISLHEMPGDRVLLTLGEWPEVGDVEAGETLPRHRALARLSWPIRTIGCTSSMHGTT